jgi:ABC-type nitrate/sulfonate/bicarbonate transport system substrate-binding protein
LLEERFPFVMEANLLESDPIDLVVRRDVAEARGLSQTLPLGERLRRLEGVRIGVGPHPRPRLAALFASQGLGAGAATVVVVPGKQQNDALRHGDVDALYTHTPFLEDAILTDGAVLIVNQSAGEVPALTGRQIHVLAATRAFVEHDPQLVGGFVSAIGRAEALIHRHPADAVDAVLRVLPERDRAHVETLLSLYAPAVPSTPRVTADGITRELPFFPDGEAVPDLRTVDLSAYVATHAEAKASPGVTGRTLAFSIALALVVLVFGGLMGSGLMGRKISGRNVR